MLFLADVELPPIVADNGVLILVAVIGGLYVLYRNKDKIKTQLAGSGESKSLDVKGDLESVGNQIENGIATSSLVRGICSSLCRKMIRIAQALPNKEAATKAETSLRDLFVEFGVPTQAVEAPETKVS